MALQGCGATALAAPLIVTTLVFAPLVLATVATIGCSIGPKQDDPAEGPTKGGFAEDAGGAADTSPSTMVDSPPPSGPDAVVGTRDDVGGDSRCCDTASDSGAETPGDSVAGDDDARAE